MTFDASKFVLEAEKKEGLVFRTNSCMQTLTLVNVFKSLILGTTEKEGKDREGKPTTYKSRSVMIKFAFNAPQTKKNDDGTEEKIEATRS